MSQELLERSRRLAASPDLPGSALDDLRAGMSPADVAARRGLPLPRVLGLQSFYDLLSPRVTGHVCTGTACWAARYATGSPVPPGHEVRCLGRCYEAAQAPVDTLADGDPTSLAIDRAPHPIPVRTLTNPPIVFRHLFGDLPDVKHLYDLPADATSVLVRLDASGLRGRGGAAYPTAAKWRAARDAPSAVKYVIANGDEGDPGSFVDRLLLEQTPHVVLAGMNLCAHIIGATNGIVFVRGEYPEAARAVRQAIAEARERELFTRGFEVEVRVGAGSYVCGEETALIAAIEGRRAEARPKPPYPSERGIFGYPSVVQNVETLSLVPWVVATGARPDSKAFSISGAVTRPGAVEAPLGTPLATLLADAGRPIGSYWTMALVGGPMGRVVPASAFDTPLDYTALPGMGHGGIVVLDDRVPPRALAAHLAAFAAAESCGACTPCRSGTAQLARIAFGSAESNRDKLERLLTTLEIGSLCGFGQGVPRPLRDLLAAFPDDIAGGST